MNEYDVIVVGGGHAGIEAASVTARSGLSTALFCPNLEAIGQMSCNPAIGGVAKGHVVREIDALGGVMAKAADATGIYFKMLNTSKGAAVQSPRAQADRSRYRQWMKRYLERLPNMSIRQEMVEAVLARSGHVAGVGIRTGEIVLSKYVIIATGTFLNGLIHIGQSIFPGGRHGEMSSDKLSENLVGLGLTLGRLKTGTPPRVNGKTVHWERMIPQEPDDPPQPFAFNGPDVPRNEVICYGTRTNSRTHGILARNRDRSPLFSGQIVGLGPRYCPSIEDKVVRFPHREGHQVMVEPEGTDTEECYVNGLSTSVPPDVQQDMLHSIVGLEDAHIVRYGYAVEYDFCPPTQLQPWLETIEVQGLFLAGQINGTSGYEEAAGQGVVAGYNVVRKVRGESPFIPGRHEAYIGVMVDDLTSKGMDEPYRLFTSMAEHRLLLRHDTADLRLMGYGRAMGLVDDETWLKCQRKQRILDEQKGRMEAVRVGQDRCIDILTRAGESLKGVPLTLAEMLRRPGVDIDMLGDIDPGIRGLDPAMRKTLEAEVKYAGYLRMERDKVGRLARIENMAIPEGFNYERVHALRTEARLRLMKERPATIGRVSRMRGVSQADLWVIIAAVESRRTRGDDDCG